MARVPPKRFAEAGERHPARLSSFRPRLLEADGGTFRNPYSPPLSKSLRFRTRSARFRAFRKELVSERRLRDISHSVPAQVSLANIWGSGAPGPSVRGIGRLLVVF